MCVKRLLLNINEDIKIERHRSFLLDSQPSEARINQPLLAQLGDSFYVAVILKLDHH